VAPHAVPNGIIRNRDGKTRNNDSLDASGLTCRRSGVESNAIVEEEIASANGFSGWR
jgi:hypothetical protein